MSVLTYPLNGVTYNAEDAEAYLCTRESGVYSAENNFAIEITGAMQVSIGNGIAWIKNEEFAGKVIKNSADVSLDVPIADGEFARIDRVVIQFDKAKNASEIVLKKGTASTIPVAPPIVRDEIIYELGIYEIFVDAGVVEITDADIKNTMLDESVCGLMRDGVTSIPTETLQKQAEGIIKKINQTLENAVAGKVMPHATTHARGGNDELTPYEIGAVSFYTQGLTDSQKEKARENIGALGKNEVILNGEINLSIENETEYTFGSVTSLRLIGTINKAHGFIGFAPSTPSVYISGFNGMSGDDITSAKAKEIWEFSCDDGFVIWKNWTNAEAEASANGTVVADGGYYIPSIDEQGNLFWQGSKPNMILPEVVNIKGPKGEPGVGTPGLVWAGEWDEETTYTAIKNGQVSRDVVYYNGSAYVANHPAPITGINPEEDISGIWEILVKGGGSGRLSGNTSDTTPVQVVEALAAGQNAFINHTDNTYGVVFFSNFTFAVGINIVAASVTFEHSGTLYNASLTGDITAETWSFFATQLATKDELPKTATAVDLSGFENGTVVETYSDGSAKTYTFEFDSDGNPVKITDSDGNETVLTW